MARRRPKYLRKNKIRLPLSAYLIYLLVLTTLITGVSFSSYVASSQSVDEARVAVMAVDAVIDVTNLMINQHPGGVTVIPVTVTNQDGSRICEVAQAYTLEVERLSENLPLNYTFYEDSACTKEVQAPDGLLAAGTLEEDHFWLKVTWPAPGNAADAFEIDAFRIVVHAQQVD